MYTAKWLDIVLYLGCIQGIFLLFLLWNKRPENKQAMTYLLTLIGTVSILIFGRVNYQPEWVQLFAVIIMLPDVILFLAGPLLWLFTRSLLQLPLPSRKRQWLHFTPALLHCTIVNFALGLNLAGFFDFLTGRQIVAIFHVIEGAAIISLSSYLVMSYRCHKQYINSYEHDFSTPLKTKFLQYFYVTVMAMILFWIPGFLNNLFSIQPDYTTYSMVWVIITFGIYYLAFMVLSHPSILNLPKIEMAESTAEYGNPADYSEEVETLKKFMLAEKPYLDTSLSLADLAEQTGWSKHDLSKIINQGFGVNFFDFINKYRVEEFIQSKRHPSRQNASILEIAYSAGFNSKSAFNRAFKKEMETSPSIFLKQANGRL